MAGEVLPIGVPPKEAIEYFRRKGYRISFDWQDVMRTEHAKAFTVAKVARLDVLEDIRAAIDKAIANGTTLEQFKKELTPLLQAKGWWGRQQMVDPKDGKAKHVQLGSPRRLETIYDTNLRTSYAAGQWEQIQATKARRPYLRYIHLDSAHPRPQHKAWHNLVLPADDPFWLTHFPPNGWHCHCSVQQLSDRDLKRWGYNVGQAPPVVTTPYENPRTGEVRHVPVGIDPGFDYNAGISTETQAKGFVDKIAAVSADLGAAVWADAKGELVPPLDRGYAKWADALLSNTDKPTGSLWGVGALSPETLAAVRARGIEPASAAITLTDRDLLHLLRPAKAGRDVAIPQELARHLPAQLAAPRAVLWDKVAGDTLVYVLDAPGEAREAKIVVRINYRTKTVVEAVGEKLGLTVNSVRTAGLVEARVLTDTNRYELVEGAL